MYQYDEIYDTMKEDKQKKVAVAKQDKTSKYAKNLIRNAAVRKLENDRLENKFIYQKLLVKVFHVLLDDTSWNV